MNPLYEILRSDGSLSTSKALLHAIGLHEAILFQELLSKYSYFESKDMLEDGWFYNTAENIWQDTGLTTKQQRLSIKRLEELGLIQTKVMGIPATKYFKVNNSNDKIFKLMAQGKQIQQFGQKGKTRCDQKSKQVVTKGNLNNTKNNTKNNTNTHITLTSDEPYLSFFLSVYADTFNKEHDRVARKDIEYIEWGLHEIKSNLDYEQFTEALYDFMNDNYKKNVNIKYFLEVFFRYGELDTSKRAYEEYFR